MGESTLLIENFAIPTFGNHETGGLAAAARTIDEIRRRGLPKALIGRHQLRIGVEQMMFAAPYVALYYSVDRKELLEVWATLYGEPMLDALIAETGGDK